MPSKAITVRNLPSAVALAVRAKARREGLSLNKAVLKLLEEATGTKARRDAALHHDLDRFFGTWTRQEADAFDKALIEQRSIDPDLWR